MVGAFALIAGMFVWSLPLAGQGAAVRGNPPGEWRYWGADAWSTRYSSLDQINAANFSQLQVEIGRAHV